jgi:hypothetical protein
VITPIGRLSSLLAEFAMTSIARNGLCSFSAMAFRRQYIYDLSFLFSFASYGLIRPEKIRLPTTMMMRLRSTILFSFPSLLDEQKLSTKLPRPEKKARGLFPILLSFHTICSNVLASLAYLQEEKFTRKAIRVHFSSPRHTRGFGSGSASNRPLLLSFPANQDEKLKDTTDLFHLAFLGGRFFFSFSSSSSFQRDLVS